MAHISNLSKSIKEQLADAATDTDGKPLRWFIGAYVPREIKRALIDEGTAQHRTLSQQLLHILTVRYSAPATTKGKKPK